VPPLGCGITLLRSGGNLARASVDSAASAAAARARARGGAAAARAAACSRPANRQPAVQLSRSYCWLAAVATAVVRYRSTAVRYGDSGALRREPTSLNPGRVGSEKR
jgi:hypothetical protein